jgi:hypothetical protein
MTKQQLREALRKMIKEELKESNDIEQILSKTPKGQNIAKNITPEDEEIISQILGETLNEIAIGQALKKLTLAGLLALAMLGGSATAQTSTPPGGGVKYGSKLTYLKDIKKEVDQRTQNLARKHFGEVSEDVLENGFKIVGIDQNGGIIYKGADERYGEVGLIVHKNGKVGYVDTRTGKLMGAADQQNLSSSEISSFLINNTIKRINTTTASLRETVRRIIKQALNEALTPEEQQELAEAWEPEVADPDVDTDTKIIPDEDEDDLTFSPDSIPKVNPKAEREMIKKIIARYDSLTEKKYK